jgi:Triose-phosphate Transporter family
VQLLLRNLCHLATPTLVQNHFMETLQHHFMHSADHKYHAATIAHTSMHSLNVAYNYSNKKALNMIKAPLTLSALQMLVGVAYVLPLWLFKLRAAPSMSRDNLKTLLPIGSCHAASHLAAVIGLGAGSVSFTHIVKVSFQRIESIRSCNSYAHCLHSVF